MDDYIQERKLIGNLTQGWLDTKWSNEVKFLVCQHVMAPYCDREIHTCSSVKIEGYTRLNSLSNEKKKHLHVYHVFFERFKDSVSIHTSMYCFVHSPRLNMWLEILIEDKLLRPQFQEISNAFIWLYFHKIWLRFELITIYLTILC